MWLGWGRVYCRQVLNVRQSSWNYTKISLPLVEAASGLDPVISPSRLKPTPAQRTCGVSYLIKLDASIAPTP